MILSAWATTWATTGQSWSLKRNKDADRELAKVLAELDDWHVRITGYSPITHHAEPSWAFPMPLEPACDLAKRFHQDALYYVEGDQLSMTHCDHRRSLVPIGSFRDRDDDDSKKGGWRCDGTTLGPFAVWTKAARQIAESANVRGTVRAGPFPR